MDHAIVAVGSV